MARLLVIVFALATTCAGQPPRVVSAQNGQVSIGRISGGSFGSGSFTDGEPGRSYASSSNQQPQSWNRGQYPMGGGKVIYGSTHAKNGEVAIGRVTGGSFGQDAFSVGAPGRRYGFQPWNNQGNFAPSNGYNNQNEEPMRPTPKACPADVEKGKQATWQENDCYQRSVRAQNGQVSIGRLTGGSFGQGSFSVAEPGRNYGYGNQYWNRRQYPNAGRVIYGSTHARNGQVAIGSVTGGSFGQDAFSVGAPGRSYGYQSWNSQQGSSTPSYYGYNNQNSYPNNPFITGFNRGDGTSIAIDKITGGSFPDNSFSIGHGRDSY